MADAEQARGLSLRNGLPEIAFEGGPHGAQIVVSRQAPLRATQASDVLELFELSVGVTHDSEGNIKLSFIAIFDNFGAGHPARTA